MVTKPNGGRFLVAIGLLLLLAPLAAGQEFIRGDVDADGTVDGVVDANHALALLHLPGHPSIDCFWAADANGDGSFDISDALFILNYQLVEGSPVPPAPGPLVCGPQPLTTPLSCSGYPCVPVSVSPDPDHVLGVEDFVGYVGQSRSLAIIYDHQGPDPIRVNGVSFGLMHDPSRVQLSGVSLGSGYSSLTGGGPSYYQINLYPTGFTFGALNDFLYNGAFEPGSYELVTAWYSLIDAGDSALEFTESLGNPPVPLSVATLPAVTRIQPTAIDGVVEATIPTFRRGDANDDGVVDIGDAIRVLHQLFVPGQPGRICEDASDVNDDSAADISDAVHLLSYLFTSGPAIPAPFPDCGTDPTLDSLGCVTSFCF